MRKLKKEIWPYQVIVTSANDKVDEWCTENLGHRFSEWYGFYVSGGKLYAFKDEATLLVFKLRWNCHGQI